MIFTSLCCRNPERGINRVAGCAERIIKGVRSGRLFHWPDISQQPALPGGGAAAFGRLHSDRSDQQVLVVLLPVVALLLAGWSVVLAVPASADDCALQHVDATVQVRQVIDGDTVRLANRKLLRFMSINTPEIDHRRHTAEPMAKAARAALQELIGPSLKIQVQYGRHQRYDRHGRLLAHVFTDKGVNVQQRMLEQGLGFWIAVPPNLALMSCYHQAEQAARRARRGVWALDYYRPQSTAQLRDNERGFRFITGVISRVDETKRSIWLDLNGATAPATDKTRVALRISRDDLHYFKDKQFSQWQGRRITARGWMYPYKGQLVMRIKHPAALEWRRAGSSK